MTVNNSLFSKSGILLGAGISTFALNSCDLNKAPERPNIIFIMSDDHASQAISAYGSQLNQTPNIDRLVKEGVVFNNCFCTNAISAPSRASILTGKYNHANGQINNDVVFDGTQQTFPKLLQKAGYQTAMIGKWHLKSDPTGFDYWKILPGQGHYYNPDFVSEKGNVRHEGYVTDLITDLGLDWLEDANKGEEPFCLMLQHKAPHRTWMPHPDNMNMYDTVKFPVPETLYDDGKDRGSAANEQELSIRNHMYMGYDLKLTKDSVSFEVIEDLPNSEFKRMTPEQRQAWDKAYANRNLEYHRNNPVGDELLKWKYQRYMQDYLACIASVDENIGRVLDYLDENGLSENTIVVYTSDQGFFLGEHGWFDKRFMYEEALRMPLIIRYPEGIKSKSTMEEMVLNIDFAPTLLDFAKAEIPEDMHGNSILPLLEKEQENEWRENIYYHYYEYPGYHAVKRHYGLRTDRYKLIHFYYDVDEWEFYDLEHDPDELNNQINNPEYEILVDSLKRVLNRQGEIFQMPGREEWITPSSVKNTHQGLGKKIQLEKLPSAKFSMGKVACLNDGFVKDLNLFWADNLEGWLGFEGDNLSAIIDLEEKLELNQMEIHFLENIPYWIFGPEDVFVSISDDGRSFTEIPVVNWDTIQGQSRSRIISATLPVNESARYVMVKAKNIEVCPKGHPGAGKDAWLFVDEIAIK